MKEPDMAEYVSVKAVRVWLVALFVVTMAVPALFAYRGQLRDQEIAHNTDTVAVAARQSAAATAKLSEALYMMCEDRNVAADNVNTLLDAIVLSVKEGTTLPPAEQKARIDRYEDSRASIIDCY
jgi:hypothetical protein